MYNKNFRCVICMIEFNVGDKIRSVEGDINTTVFKQIWKFRKVDQ